MSSTHSNTQNSNTQNSNLNLDQLDAFSLQSILSQAKGPKILLLPLGSVEPHGPHLPLSTDRLISQKNAKLACQNLQSQGYCCLIAPPVPYGVTEFARDFCGAISLKPDVFIQVLQNIISSYLHLFDHVCLINHHLEPGQIQSIEHVKAEIIEKFGPKAISHPMVMSKRWGRLLGQEFKSGACHAGSYEGSLVLSADQSLVKMEIAQNLPSLELSLSKGIGEQKTSFKEIGMDHAYTGNPASASVEEGDALYLILTEMVVTEILSTIAL